MTKEQEAALRDRARAAKDLRDTADTADAMLRSWSRHKRDPAVARAPERREVYLSMSDRGISRWHVGTHFPAFVIERELVPLLRRVRDKARADLSALEMP